MVRRSVQNILLVTLLLHSIPLTVCAQVVTENRERVMLGVRLRPKVTALLTEVEKLYGKQVQAQFANISRSPEGGDTAGRAIVSDDGTPNIKIDNHVDRNDVELVESIIAHELLHLKLRAKGYPVLFFHGETDLMTQVGPYLSEAGNTLRNGIEHWMFYQEMQAMGFSSASTIKSGMEKFRQAARAGRGDDVLLALYYYRAVLEYDDPSLLAQLRRGYIEGNRIGVVKLGESLAQIVLSRKPRTQDDVTATLLQCLNALFQKLITFTVLPLTEKTSGSVVLRRVNLQVTRP